MAVAQVPGLKLQRQESLSWLSCPSPGHMSLSYRTGRAQDPRQLWGPFRQEIQDHCVLVSYVQIQGPMPHQASRPGHSAWW